MSSISTTGKVRTMIEDTFEKLFDWNYGGFSEEYVEDLLDDDEVSIEEAGFWEGEILAEKEEGKDVSDTIDEEFTQRAY